jgi:uncharacterized membrane protein
MRISIMLLSLAIVTSPALAQGGGGARGGGGGARAVGAPPPVDTANCVTITNADGSVTRNCGSRMLDLSSFGRRPLGAQNVLPQPQAAPGDLFMRHLYAPELVMANQAAIQLQDVQRTKIVQAMTQAQAKFTEVQWALSAEQEKLDQLVKEVTVDEVAVIRQLDRIMGLEQEVKRNQLALLVRVKNALSPEQQTRLADVRCVAGAGSPGDAVWYTFSSGYVGTTPPRRLTIPDTGAAFRYRQRLDGVALRCPPR